MAGAAGRGRAASATTGAAGDGLTAGTLGHERRSDALGLAFTGGALGWIGGLAHRAQKVKFLAAVHATVFVDRHIL